MKKEAASIETVNEPRLTASFGQEISKNLLHKMNGYWRAANYLSVGQIYLHDNPLMKEPLKPEHIKHILLGHWGTKPPNEER